MAFGQHAREIFTFPVSMRTTKDFELIRNSGGRRTSVSEVVCDKNEVIHGRQKRFDRWAERFNVQFSQPHANTVGPTVAAHNWMEIVYATLRLATDLDRRSQSGAQISCFGIHCSRFVMVGRWTKMLRRQQTENL